MLDRVDAISIPSHAASPITHIRRVLHFGTIIICDQCDPEGPEPIEPLYHASHRQYCRRGVRAAGYFDEVLAEGVWVTRARRLRRQELVEVRPCIRLAVTAVLSRKECERAAAVINAAVTKVLAKRK